MKKKEEEEVYRRRGKLIGHSVASGQEYNLEKDRIHVKVEPYKTRLHPLY